MNQQPVSIDAFSFLFEGVMEADSDDMKSDWRETAEFRSSQEGSFSFGLHPLENLNGSAEIRFWGDPVLPAFTTEPAYLGYDETEESTEFNLALYAGEFTLSESLFDLHGYYRTGHGDWYLHGDPFYLMPEAWDRYNMDIDGSDAPYGLELEGKNSLDGLWLAFGPELYWGALPQGVINYSRPYTKGEFNGEFGLTYKEIFVSDDTAYPAKAPGRKISFSGSLELAPYAFAEMALLHAGGEKIGENYNQIKSTSPGGGIDGSDVDVLTDSIDLMDTFAFKGLIGTEILRFSRVYLRYTYAGLAAEAEPMIPRSGFQKADPGSGNNQQIDAGARIIIGDITAETELRYRVPLVDPMMNIGDYSVRSPLDDPFSVFWNREILEGELVLTYDPEGATYFHDWNNEDRENADLAASLSFLYTAYAGPTDAAVFKDAEGEWAAFADGLPEEKGLWSLSGRLVMNPLSKFRLTAEGHIGHQQSAGEDDRVVNYAGLGLSGRYEKLMLDTQLDLSSWGPETWYRQFNITYPAQWTVDLSYGFESPSFLSRTGRIGIRSEGRVFGDFSADDEPSDGYALVTTVYTEISY